MADSGKTAFAWLLGILLVLIAGVVFVRHVITVDLPELSARLDEQKTAARWEELRKAAIIAGTPLMENPQLQAMDYDAQSARLLELYKNRSLNFDDPELGKAWTSIETDSSAGLLILEEIGYIDRVKPSGYQILANAFQNDDQANRQAWNDFVQRGFSEGEKADLEQQLRGTEDRLDGSIGSLQTIAENLTRNEIPNAVSVQYLPSWDGTYQGDNLQITNTSGNALQGAIVVTTVRMNSGMARVHVHYADQWPAYSTLKAVYSYWGTEYQAPQTAGDPQNIDVAVYVPSGTAKANYVLTSETWEKIVQSYCSSLTYSGDYLAAYSDGSGNYDAGFKFQFHGLPTLPVTSVEVQFTDDDGSALRDYTWTPNERLVSDRDYPMRGPALNGPTPGHIDFILRFSETDYAQRVHRY